MSNALAVATATVALRELVYAAVSSAVPGAQVTYARPGAAVADAPGGDAGPGARTSLFLYGVTPNAAYRNADLPTRRGDAALARRPQVAIDLHYLISFSGNDAQLEPQRMLGSVVRALHAQPILTRGLITTVKDENDFIENSDLDEAPELVRVTPVSLSLEELSKLWSVLFQTPYALSVAYQASVVLIEADEEAPRPGLPVRGRNVYVAELRRPRVDAVAEAGGPGAPILPGGVLVLRGRGLAGEVTRVRLGTRGDEFEPSLVTPGEVRLPLASVPPERLRAGIQGVQVVHRWPMGTPPVPHRGEESNVAPFVLRPVVRRDAAAPARYAVRVLPPAPGGGSGGGPRRVEVRVTPDVERRQYVELLLNGVADADRPAFLYPGRDRADDGDTLVFDAPGLEDGRYLVRVRIDGAESVLEPDPSAPGDASLARPWVEIS